MARPNPDIRTEKHECSDLGRSGSAFGAQQRFHTIPGMPTRFSDVATCLLQP
ncbi:MAG: hypothetical protein MI923_16870 [Phycisphaerales bacterium]|nr:hypothetical protein [Phycisphaerales bacterium]